MDKLDEVLLEGPSDGQLVTLIHGWPDDLHLWDDIVQDLLSTGKFRCLRVTMPGYGKVNNEKVIDPNFHEVADLIADVIQHYRRNHQEKSILMAHDWGSVVAFNLQRNFEHLISEMIIMDVGPIDLPFRSALIQGLRVVGMGLYYQWLNMLAYYLWRYIPIVGEPLGNAIHNFEVRRFKQFPDGSVHPRTNLKQSASAAYFYHYYQANFFLDHFFGFSLRGGNPLPQPPKDPYANPSVPILFLHGNKRGSLGRFFASWSNKLNEREDSDVCMLNGDHWFMLWSPKETSEVIIKWLDLGPNGGKLSNDFKKSMLAKGIEKGYPRCLKSKL
jgi:pimeloyl-ACP methyl ester carboxylesterase